MNVRRVPVNVADGAGFLGNAHRRLIQGILHNIHGDLQINRSRRPRHRHPKCFGDIVRKPLGGKAPLGLLAHRFHAVQRVDILAGPAVKGRHRRAAANMYHGGTGVLGLPHGRCRIGDPRPRRGNEHPRLAAHSGIGICRKPGRVLMAPHVDLNPLFPAAVNDIHDVAAGQGEHAFHPFPLQLFGHQPASRQLRHRLTPFCPPTQRTSFSEIS